ncbi:MAG TPA: VCBS repeat-containing protein [Solirubrobacteraceae bacterium]|jgi:hypothetical protein
MMRAFRTATVVAAALLLGAVAPAAQGIGFTPLPGSPYATINPPFTPGPGGYLGGMAEGDFNHDGIADLAVTESTGAPALQASGESVSILLGSHDGGLALTSGSPISIFSGGIISGASSIATGDFNDDQIADLAVVDPVHGAVTILRGDGHGDFHAEGPTLPFAGNTDGSLAVGDFNDDGKQDIAVIGSNVTVFLGDGHGGFAQASGSPVMLGGYGLTVAAGDFNGDDRTDLAVRESQGTLIVFLAGPSGEMKSAEEIPLSGGATPDSLATADLNHDRKLDLAMANDSNDTAGVMLGDGHGGFSAPPGSPFPVPGAASISEPGIPQSIGIGDFDDDSAPDLALANFNGSSDNVAILTGDGSGAFASPSGALFPARGNPRPLVVGDFNGDGEPDIAVANSFQGRVTVLANCGATACPPPDEPPPYEPPAYEPEPVPREQGPNDGPPLDYPPTAAPGNDSASNKDSTGTLGSSTTAPPAGPPSIGALVLARQRIHVGHGVSLTVQLPQAATIVVELRRAGAAGRDARSPHLTSLGSITLAGHQGTNTVTIQRLHGRRLALGRYLLLVTAKTGGATSSAKVVRLTVVR